MKVLVAGIRSALGSRVARLLRDDGHEVVGLSRSEGPGLFVADLLDPSSTRAAVLAARPDAIVQTVNALPKGGPRSAADVSATSHLRRDGTRNLLAAAREAAVSRFVAEAFVFGYESVSLGAPPITEQVSFGTGPDEASHALGVLDGEVLAYGGITVRCGLFYGPGVGSTDAQISMVRRRRFPAVRGARNVLPYVHIDDAAACVAAALLRGRPGEAYNATGDIAEPCGVWLREVAAAIGAPPPRQLPAWLFNRLAGTYAARFARVNLPVSNAKARAELGWAPAYPTVADGAKTLA